MLEYRLQAGIAAWHRVSRFWQSGVPPAWEINLSKWYLANACYSGVETLSGSASALTTHAWHPLTGFLAARAKVLLYGAAVGKEYGTVRAISKLLVLIGVRLASPRVEIQYRRAQWLQYCLVDLLRCVQFWP